VEIDGAYFGGYVKPENEKADRKDRRLVANQTGKRQCVVVMRERNGKSLTFVVRNEGDSVPFVRDHVGTLATIHADEGSGWDALHAGWDTKRVNHSVKFYDKGRQHEPSGVVLLAPAPHGNRHARPYRGAVLVRLCR